MIRAVSRERQRVSAWVTGFLCLAIVLGIFFRFENLAGKTFWEDESYTALHASGHLDRGELRPLFDGTIRPVSEIQQLERRAPDRGIGSTISAVAAEDSDQGVLFYVLERGSIAMFGSSIVAYRVVSVLFGILTILAAWLLGIALFESAGVAAIFAAIVALSPFEVLYSHEARSYTLTAFLTLMSSYLVLRALQRRNVVDWALYTVCIAAGLYTSLLIVLVAFAHVVYTVLVYRRETRAVAALCLSILGAALAFAPWVSVMARNHTLVATELNWGATAYSWRAMIEKWLFNANAQFFDLEWISLKYALFGGLVLLLIAVSLVYMIRTAPLRQWSFVVLLGGITVVFFVGRDLVEHGHWSTTARYLIPAWLAIQLSVAYAIDAWVSDSRRARSVVGAAVLIVLLAGEAISSFAGTRSETWYDNELSAATPHIAAVVNSAPMPALMIGEKCWAFFLDESNYLDPRVHVELFADARNAHIRTAGYSDVFVTTPTRTLLSVLQRQGYKLQQVYAYQNASSPYATFHRAVGRAGRTSGIDTSTPSFPNTLYRIVNP